MPRTVSARRPARRDTPYALQFRGNLSSDYVSVPNNVQVQPGTGDFSVEFTIRPTQFGNDVQFNGVVGCRPWTTATDNGWAIALDMATGSMKLNSHFADGSTGWDVLTYLPATRCAFGQFQHWIAVFDRTNSKMLWYLNGELDVQHTSVTYPSGSVAPTQSMFFGRDSASGSRRLAAVVGDVRTYKYAVSAAQAKQRFYRYQDLGSEAGIYRLTAGSGSTATDTSGNGNNGTITGAVWTAQTMFKGAPTVISTPRALASARTVVS